MAEGDVLAAIDPTAIQTTPRTMIFRFKNERKAYKTPSTQREFHLMQAAGDCAVNVHGRSFTRDSNGEVRMMGIIMDLEQPFVPSAIGVDYRFDCLEEMESVIHKLHEKGIIHGDVKPSNFVLCSGWKLRLCDFADAMRVRENRRETKWGGGRTIQYLAPSRLRDWPVKRTPPPRRMDDFYALGLSIWELYTGKEPHNDIEDQLNVMWAVKNGKTVDLDEVKDQAVRDIIRGYLRCGGAKV